MIGKNSSRSGYAGAGSRGMNDNYKMDVEHDEMSYEYKPSDAYLIKEIELKKSLLIDEFK